MNQKDRRKLVVALEKVEALEAKNKRLERVMYNEIQPRIHMIQRMDLTKEDRGTLDSIEELITFALKRERVAS